ncbi:DEAD/DEAH box helicase [Nocardia fusca]|uniref:DEAD/DEAH box helicase n=1 Tax=Nocardia fusca TaxID=941183 RepID=UPI0037BA7334
MAVGGAERRRRAGIVRFWRAVELFSPQQLDPVDPRKDMYAAREGEPLPWEPGHAIESKRLERGKVWQHTVYAGVFDITRMREVVRRVFGVDEADENFDGRHGGHTALLAFTVNQEGRLLRDSPVLSSCAWAVGRALSPGPDDSGWLDGFDDDQAQCLGTLLQLADGRLPVVERDAGSAVGGGALTTIAGVAANVVLDAATGGIGALAATVSAALGPVLGPIAAGAVGTAGTAAATAAVERAEQAVAERISGPVPAGADGSSTGTAAPVLDKTLDIRSLAAVVRWVAEYLGVDADLVPDAVRIKSRQVRVKRADESSQQDFLNSFIAEDLDRVAGALADGDCGRALTEYLRPNGDSLDISARTDVRRRTRVLLDGVQPAAMPLGRWPETATRPLALSQQFAVNTALTQLGGADDAAGLYAVNGPPGTGKTTMLRDIIAALVVQRAERLAELPTARAAFGPPVSWSVDGRNHSVYPPVSALTGFEMVIASANNGAVENVTTEIPAVTAIAEEWREVADYLAEPAGLLLEAPAWGAVAARLGNSANRFDFKERFWWGTDEKANSRRTGKGLHDLLKRAEISAPAHEDSTQTDSDPDDPPLGRYTWQQAVERFGEHRAKVAQLATQRQQASEAGRRLAESDALLNGIRAEIPAATSRLTTEREALATARTTCAQAQAEFDAVDADRREIENAIAVLDEEATLYRDLCRAAQQDLEAFDRSRAPGFWSRIFDHSAGERQYAERERLAAEVRRRESVWETRRQHRDDERGSRLAPVLTRLRAAEVSVRNAEAAVADRERSVNAAEAALARVHSRLVGAQNNRATDLHTFEQARSRWGSAVPGSEWDAAPDDRSAAETRELSAPWMDTEFAEARSELFLAALDLHRALLAAEAWRVRTSMLSAMEIISRGPVKDMKPHQVRAVWQLLFLIVPVVSTTFASLARMFKGLESEALGWLFVDEAGQAAPQQAVGALWRAQRAVIVGDPLQLEPVVTLPWTAQERLCQHFSVSLEWAPGRTSVQCLADRLTTFGTTLSGQDIESVWVGSPLRVHRRCDGPMFEISNTIAYDGMMVFGTAPRSPYPLVANNVWMDVQSAAADGKWIPAEGRVLTRALDLIEARLRRSLSEELAAGSPPLWATSAAGRVDPLEAELRRRMAESVFVISPFREVKAGLLKVTRGRLPTNRVGTVHTTQGKEADTVVLVLGTRADRRGARDWAATSPNLLNVAVSRARRRLIVIGNHTAWSRHRYFSELAGHADFEPTEPPAGWIEPC